MNRPILIACLMLTACHVGGCASLLTAGLPKTDKLPLSEKFMEQYGDRCTSHIYGSLGLGASGAFDISCRPPTAGAATIVPLSDKEALRALLRELLAEEVAKARTAE